VPTSTDRKFVVVSGLPGSAKSWLTLQLAPLLGLDVIDKDDILERLFDSKGIGDSAWRRTLSRESDLIFRQKSEASKGGLLVSHWHLSGMSLDSGTPTEWLEKLSSRIVNLHCECPVEVAAARFSQRKRHPGHLDNAKSPTQILASIQKLARLQPPAIGERVYIDTSAEINLEDLVGKISKAFDRRPNLVG
jgi:predicted kinase